MRRSGPAVGLLMVAALIGCVKQRRFPAPNLPLSSRLVPSDANAGPSADEIRRVNAEVRGPRTVLAISSGGLYGAYTVGVLKGWAERGDRPKFDVVTGVSTGALIATLAFLGPEYDAKLEEWYTTARPNDVYDRRWLPALFWADSAATDDPLRKRVEANVTPELLARVAKEHAAGRRLYIGTTDLDTGRQVTWDMGAIASGSAPNKVQLFRDVVLASCAIPGLLSPIAIDIEVDGQPRTELHVDGAISASVFVPPAAFRDLPKGSKVFVIVSGKVSTLSRAVPRRLLAVGEASLASLLRTQTRGELLQIAVQADQAQTDFGYTAVPEDFPIGSSNLGLTPKVLRNLFDEGYYFATKRRHWIAEPPGLDGPLPRTGPKMSIQDKAKPKVAGQPELLPPSLR